MPESSAADGGAYSPEVERRFRELPGAGKLPPGDGPVLQARAGEAVRGALVEFDARARDAHIATAVFGAYGCPHFIAAASWLTERLSGMDAAALASWDWQQAATALAIPPAKFGRLLLLQDAVRSLGGSLQRLDSGPV